MKHQVVNLEVGVEVVQFLFLVDLAWRPSLVCGLCVTDLMSHSTFPCWGPLAPATGSVVHTSCGLDIAVPTALAPAPPIGGARAFGYGGAHQGNTGCGTETMTLQPVARQRMPNRTGRERRVHEGCGGRGENAV